MSDSTIQHEKITTTPTLSAWATSYAAGSLFVVLSLHRTEVNEDESLSAIGKEVLNNLEAEFFTLEQKNLVSIKEAITIAAKDVAPDCNLSLASVVVVQKDEQTILYAFALGALVVLQRRDTLATIVTTDTTQLKSASGFLEAGDTIVLQTKQFAENVSRTTLSTFLTKSLQTAAEESTTALQEAEEKAASAAILLSYKRESKESIKEQVTPVEEELLPQVEEAPKRSLPKLKLPKLPQFSSVKIFLPSFVSRQKRIFFLVLAVFCMLAIIIGIKTNSSNTKDTAVRSLLANKTKQAQVKFDEAEALNGLNKNLAMSDYQDAKTILTTNIPSHTNDSKEAQEFNALLQKVTDKLSGQNGTNITATKTDPTKSIYLNIEQKFSSQTSGKAIFTQNDNTVYYADTSGVTTIDKATQKAKQIIKNANDWSDVGGIATYLGNIYVIDKKSQQILKYTVSDSGFGKSNYLPTALPDLANATSMTIDGSVWVLLQNGKILKFTKGQLQSFSLSSQTPALTNPIVLFTTLDGNNLYVLDSKNKSIVIFDKTGNYQASYTATILGNAKDFEVDEKNKKMYVLSGSDVFELSLP